MSARLLRAQLYALRTTRTTWALLAATSALVAFSVASEVAAAGQGDNPSLTATVGVRAVFDSVPTTAGALALVLGVLLSAGQHRHRTITTTYLVTPSRGRVVAAQLAAGAVAGALVAGVASATALAVGAALLRGRDAAGLAESAVPRMLAGAAAVLVLYALLGVALGALLRQQAGALVGGLLWLFVVEGLLVATAPDVGRWLVGGAAAAVVSVGHAPDLLPPAAGAVLLLGYAVAAALAAARVAARTDVT